MCYLQVLILKTNYAPKREFNMALQPFVTLWVESTWRSHRISHGAILLGKTLSGTKSLLDSCHAAQRRSNRLVFASAKQPCLIPMAVLPWGTRPTLGTVKGKSPPSCTWTSINTGPGVSPQRLFPFSCPSRVKPEGSGITPVENGCSGHTCRKETSESTGPLPSG